MKFFAAASAACFGFALLTTPAQAADSVTTIVYEGFDYADTGAVDLIDGASGGDGWTTDWAWTYSSGSGLQVGSPGLSYADIQEIGNKASFYNRGVPNQISQLERSFPAVADGVTYIQLLSSNIANSNGSSGGGTPRIQFYFEGSPSFSLGGNGKGDGTVMGLLDSSLENQLIASNSALTTTNLLTILRIDHDAGVTSLWTNPTLSTFDYANPPTPDGTVSQTFSMDKIYIMLRQGSIDEIKIMRLDSSSPSSSIIQRESLVLTNDLGVSCSRSSIDGIRGEWVELPDLGDCSIPELPDRQVLGWATRGDFPVDIAQRQIDNGWGPYEWIDESGKAIGVFIPAGWSTFLSNSVRLYPITASRSAAATPTAATPTL